MRYFVFSAKVDADFAEQQIIENVRQWVSQYSPDAISGDGQRLRGRNAATGEFADVFTERWAIPQQIADGRWVFPKPTQDKTSPIPVDVFTLGVVAAEAEYDPAWFPGPPMAP